MTDPTTPRCDRVLIGQGTDTWDPVCIRPKHHIGPCSAAPLPDTKLDDYGIPLDESSLNRQGEK